MNASIISFLTATCFISFSIQDLYNTNNSLLWKRDLMKAIDYDAWFKWRFPESNLCKVSWPSNVTGYYRWNIYQCPWDYSCSSRFEEIIHCIPPGFKDCEQRPFICRKEHNCGNGVCLTVNNMKMETDTVWKIILSKAKVFYNEIILHYYPENHGNFSLINISENDRNFYHCPGDVAKTSIRSWNETVYCIPVNYEDCPGHPFVCKKGYRCGNDKCELLSAPTTQTTLITPTPTTSNVNVIIILKSLFIKV